VEKKANLAQPYLEANQQVPKMEGVTKHLLHEECKPKGRKHKEGNHNKALASQSRFNHKKGESTSFNCHYCGKPGHFKRNCRKLAADNKKEKFDFKAKKEIHKANKATVEQGSSDDDALVVTHALSSNLESSSSWIIDSGATSYMCNDQSLFDHTYLFKKPQKVTLGDGHTLEAIGQGVVTLKMTFSNKKTKRCHIHNVLCVP